MNPRKGPGTSEQIPDADGPAPDTTGHNPDTDRGLQPEPRAQAGQSGTDSAVAGPKPGTQQEHNGGRVDAPGVARQSLVKF